MRNYWLLAIKVGHDGHDGRVRRPAARSILDSADHEASQKRRSYVRYLRHRSVSAGHK